MSDQYELTGEYHADVNMLLERLRAAEVDAGRYRWIRSNERTVVVRDSCSHLYGDEMDDLIDQEMKAQNMALTDKGDMFACLWRLLEHTAPNDGAKYKSLLLAASYLHRGETK